MRRNLYWSTVKKALGTLNRQPTVWTQDLGVKWDLHASYSSNLYLYSQTDNAPCLRSFKSSSILWIWSRGRKYSKNDFLNLDHVSTGSLLASSLWVLTRVHQRWAHSLNRKEIALTFFLSKSSPSNKFSTVPKNESTVSSLTWAPLEKIGGWTLLQMSCKRVILPFWNVCNGRVEEEKNAEGEVDLAFFLSVYDYMRVSPLP